MKKFYIAANIIGAVEIKANSAEEAHAKAQKFLSKRFTLQPQPTGIWVFEKPNAGVGVGAPVGGMVQAAPTPDVQVRVAE